MHFFTKLIRKYLSVHQAHVARFYLNSSLVVIILWILKTRPTECTISLTGKCKYVMLAAGQTTASNTGRPDFHPSDHDMQLNINYTGHFPFSLSDGLKMNGLTLFGEQY